MGEGKKLEGARESLSGWGTKVEETVRGLGFSIPHAPGGRKIISRKVRAENELGR